MKCVIQIIMTILAFSYSINVVNGKYCKPEKTRYNGGICEECPVCKEGQETDKSKPLLIDHDLGGLTCYPCNPCPYGKYSDNETRIGRDIECVDWLNCSTLHRSYTVQPNRTMYGQCGGCLAGYFPKYPYLTGNDTPCQECSVYRRDREECRISTDQRSDISTEEPRMVVIEPEYDKDDIRPKGFEHGKDIIGVDIIAGIVVACVGVIILILIAVVYVCLKNKHQRGKIPGSSTYSSNSSAIHTTERDKLIKGGGLLTSEKGDIYELPSEVAVWCKNRLLKAGEESVVSLVAAHPTQKDQDLLYQELLPERPDVINIAKQENDFQSQCKEFLELWIKKSGKSATMFALYNAVKKVFEKLAADGKDSSKVIYERLIRKLREKINEEMNKQPKRSVCKLFLGSDLETCEFQFGNENEMGHSQAS